MGGLLGLLGLLVTLASGQVQDSGMRPFYYFPLEQQQQLQQQQLQLQQQQVLARVPAGLHQEADLAEGRQQQPSSPIYLVFPQSRSYDSASGNPDNGLLTIAPPPGLLEAIYAWFAQHNQEPPGGFPDWFIPPDKKPSKETGKIPEVTKLQEVAPPAGPNALKRSFPQVIPIFSGVSRFVGSHPEYPMYQQASQTPGYVFYDNHQTAPEDMLLVRSAAEDQQQPKRTYGLFKNFYTPRDHLVGNYGPQGYVKSYPGSNPWWRNVFGQIQDPEFKVEPYSRQSTIEHSYVPFSPVGYIPVYNQRVVPMEQHQQQHQHQQPEQAPSIHHHHQSPDIPIAPLPVDHSHFPKTFVHQIPIQEHQFQPLAGGGMAQPLDLESVVRKDNQDLESGLRKDNQEQKVEQVKAEAEAAAILEATRLELVKSGANEPSKPLGQEQEQEQEQELDDPGVAAVQFARFYAEEDLKNKDARDDAVVIEAKTDGEEPENDEQLRADIKEDQSVAQAQPSSIAISGQGGVASSGPRATAFAGDGGLAVAHPKATAISGPDDDKEKREAKPKMAQKN